MLPRFDVDRAHTIKQHQLLPTLLSRPLCITGYIGIVLFGTSLPGQPAYAVAWRTLVETWHCSINFFYVNPILNWLGVHLIESAAVSFIKVCNYAGLTAETAS